MAYTYYKIYTNEYVLYVETDTSTRIMTLRCGYGQQHLSQSHASYIHYYVVHLIIHLYVQGTQKFVIADRMYMHTGCLSSVLGRWARCSVGIELNKELECMGMWSIIECQETTDWLIS